MTLVPIGLVLMNKYIKALTLPCLKFLLHSHTACCDKRLASFNTILIYFKTTTLALNTISSSYFVEKKTIKLSAHTGAVITSITSNIITNTK